MRQAWFAALTGAALSVAACSAPELGELPVRCSEGECPEGYDCIHGVCAAPGTPVPVTLTQVSYLEGEDLRIVPQGASALVTWQTYAFGPDGQSFVGARVRPDGGTSPRLTLVGKFVAHEGAATPHYDVLRISDTELLLAITAAPLPNDESPDARLIVYRVTLPPEGQEQQAPQFSAAWPGEARMDTIGYGAVSRPKLVMADGAVELGYVQTRTDVIDGEPETLAELAVFRLTATGALTGDPSTHRVRKGLPVAVGVVDAFHASEATWWVLDDSRPSAVRVAVDSSEDVLERRLSGVGVPIGASEEGLAYIEPSQRTGSKLAGDPVQGPARIRRLSVDAGAGGGPLALEDTVVSELPVVQDTPRPAWVHRAGSSSLLVTPGADATSRHIRIFRIDGAGAAAEVASVDRFSRNPLTAVAASLVGGSLFVAWAEEEATRSTIRVAIVPEP